MTVDHYLCDQRWYTLLIISHELVDLRPPYEHCDLSFLSGSHALLAGVADAV